ncbi:MAG TPA: RNA methyltransferase [Lachnospiraceae bacterium]|nr:RNA methyltransferase [Lachnospiraceae bacterium]
MITSTGNPKIKQLVQWQTKARERRKDGVFVAEGIKMLKEAPMELIRDIYLTEDLEKRIRNVQTEPDQAVWDKISKAGYEVVSEEVMKKAADTQTPQGALIVLNQPEYFLEQILSKPNGLFLLLEDLQDPGNLGTILRTAEGAGVDGIIATRNTVDIFSPKTIRSTMGSIYRMPFIYVETLQDVILKMKESGIQTYAAHLNGQLYDSSFSFVKGTAFLIGNEGNGLRKETADLADYYIKIPMEGQVESLNAAIATALLIYEAHRQRS